MAEGETGEPGLETHRRRRRVPRTSIAVVLLTGMLGILVGIGSFTFGYGRGWSYLSSNPAACANCHVMQDHYDSWQHSSHARVAVCNDCHLPHHPIGKWLTKADNGFFHSLAFTLNNFHEPIRIRPRNSRVTQGTCLHCHEAIVSAIDHGGPHREGLSCVHCHQEVGHALR